MKKLIFIGLFVLLSNCGKPANELRILFWNTENFFHPSVKDHNPDLTYRPGSYLEYGSRAYTLQCENIAHLLNNVNAHVLALTEIEDYRVLHDLRSIIHYSRDFKIIHRDSPDRRGIDCALLFRRSKLNLTHHRFQPVTLPDGSPTRDIIETAFVWDDLSLRIFVIHAPSRYGNRDNAAHRIYTIKQLIEIIENSNPANDDIILFCGDMNDEFQDESLQTLADYSWKYHDFIRFSDPENARSYYWNGQWMNYDHFFALVRKQLDKNVVFKFKVVKKNFLLTENEKGEHVPFRFSTARKILGGYSDHLPLQLEIILQK